MKPRYVRKIPSPRPHARLLRSLFPLLIAMAASPAGAESFEWTGDSGGNWNDAANWSGTASPPRIPGSGDDVIVQGMATYPWTVDYSDASEPVYSSLQIDGNGSNVPVIVVSGRVLRTLDLSVGAEHAAILRLNGSNGAPALFVGHDAIISGNLEQAGGTTSIGHDLLVGSQGAGYYRSSGGTLSVGNDFTIRESSNAWFENNALITVGGNLVLDGPKSGDVYSARLFLYSGSSLTVTGNLIVGNGSSAFAAMVIDDADVVVHGPGGQSVFSVGRGKIGMVDLSSAGTITADTIRIGEGSQSTGILNQYAGTLITTNSLQIGLEPGSTGALQQQQGGELRVHGDAIVGAAGSAGLYVGNVQRNTAGLTSGKAAIDGNLLVGTQENGTRSIQYCHVCVYGGELDVGGLMVLGGTTTADGGEGFLEIDSFGHVTAGGLELRPRGKILNLGGGITLGATSTLAAAGTVRVNDGGLLAGNGTIPGSITVDAGGTVSPGNSIGVLTIQGDAAFLSGSTLRIEVDSNGNSDRIDVLGAITLNGATLNLVSTDGGFSTASTYTLLTATNGISGTFGNVVTNLPFFNISLSYADPTRLQVLGTAAVVPGTNTASSNSGTASLTAVALRIPTPDQHAASSPLDLIGGSPVSLLGRMTIADVEAGFLLDPLTTGIEDGQTGIGLRVGRFYSEGVHQTYEELPIRYAWKLENGMTVLTELPIGSVTTSGRGYNRQDRSFGLGGGLRVPLVPGWELKPMLRYGTVVNEDYDHIGSLASATLTSHFRTGFGNGYEFGADNLVGYFRSVGGNVAGLDARYRLHEVALHNAVRVGGPLEGTFLGSGARWSAWISDTRYLGTDLANNNFQRLGVAVTTRVSAGGRYSENLSLGLNYTQSAGGDHGVELNFGYRF